jgi:hypothetical protein
VVADQRFVSALRAVAAALNDIPAASMIIGGVAVIAAGVPRQTIDVDATVLGRQTTTESLIAIFERHALIPRDS